MYYEINKRANNIFQETPNINLFHALCYKEIMIYMLLKFNVSYYDILNEGGAHPTLWNVKCREIILYCAWAAVNHEMKVGNGK